MRLREKKPIRRRIPVLVIEEDEDLREPIRYNLYLDGFKIHMTADSSSGMEALSKYKPRLILLDTKDWLADLVTLKQRSRSRFIPVIVLIEGDLTADMEQTFEDGTDDYIIKPFEADKLGQIVKQKLKKCEDVIKKMRRTKGIPILVIDDDPSWRKLIEYNLYSDGFEVYTAEDGPSGIEAAVKHKPRLILLDIMMPGTDGLEVLSTLKYDSRTSHIPVIMLTAKSSIRDIDRAFGIGADDYITKPFEGKKLGNSIREKLEQHGK